MQKLTFIEISGSNPDTKDYDTFLSSVAGGTLFDTRISSNRPLSPESIAVFELVDTKDYLSMVSSLMLNAGLSSSAGLLAPGKVTLSISYFEKEFTDREIATLAMSLNGVFDIEFKRVGDEGFELLESRVPKPYIKFEEYCQGDNLTEVYICDIDGTISALGDREIYDGSKVHLDTLIEPTSHIIKTLNKHSAPVIFLTGRSEEHRDVTEQWLKNQGFEVNGLYMRRNRDFRPDNIVKYETIKQFEGQVNILGVFDDRPQVIRMWQAIGLQTFNVGQLGKEF